MGGAPLYGVDPSARLRNPYSVRIDYGVAAFALRYASSEGW
jgi:hypothetical protein